MTPPRLLLALALLPACTPAQGGSTGTETGASSTTTTGTASESSTSPTTGVSTTTTTATASTGTTDPGTTGTSADTTTGVMTAGPTATTDETGTSSTTGAPAGPCRSDADCKLVNDCCACDGVPVDAEIEVCDERCKAAQCDVFGVDQAICRFGTCTTERLGCDGAKVLCDAIPPQCDDGFLPETTPDCWTGKCVPIALCDTVPDCTMCPDGTVCVQNFGEGIFGWPSCEPIAPACGGQASCECMGELVCEAPFSFCALQDGAINCECPNC